MNETVIIVGAGSAGCIAAARLSEDEDRQVILLEAGEDRGGDAPLQSVNWIQALNYRDFFYPNLFVSKTVGARARLYQRGRGVGGSASTNAMLAIPGLPSDYDNYAERYGLEAWAWEQVEPWFDRLKPLLRKSSDDELTPVDKALLRSAGMLGLPDNVDAFTPDDGSAVFPRTADEHGRKSSRELWLEPARTRPTLEIRPNSQVDRLVIDDGVAAGVVLVNGEIIRADQVILCAGTFETPAILLRSEVSLEGIGLGIQDHPAISVYFSMKPEASDPNPSIPCIGSVMRFSSSHGKGDLHILPVHGELKRSYPPAHGILMAAVMRTRSFGELRLNENNPLAPPIVEERMLEDPLDRRAMREAIEGVISVLQSEAFQEIVDVAFIDEKGTPVEALRDSRVFERWLSEHVGDYFHAVGTARMGLKDDPLAVVDDQGRVHGIDNLAVWDASILPEVPSANTHLPVQIVAERLSAAYRSGEFK